MHQMVVPYEETTDLTFEGEMIGEALSSMGNPELGAKHNDQIWSELRLYRSTEGHYICEQVRSSHWRSSHQRHRVAVCDSKAQIMAFFGKGWLARELYADADIY